MTEHDKEEFRETMKLICELYSKKISRDMLRLYFDNLSQFSIDQIKDAIGGHISNKKYGSFFPKPADIKRQIEGETLSPSEEFRQYLRSQGKEVRF